MRSTSWSPTLPAREHFVDESEYDGMGGVDEVTALDHSTVVSTEGQGDRGIDAHEIEQLAAKVFRG